MNAELIITVIIIALWAIHSNHTRRRAERRAAALQRVTDTIQHIIDADADAETARKAAVLDRIKRVGIRTGEVGNLHLR